MRSPPSAKLSPTRPPPARMTSAAPREDVGPALDVIVGDDVLARLDLLAQAVDELRPEDVDLPVQDAPLVGDRRLLLGELVDQVLQLLVGERAEVGKGVHGSAPSDRQAGPRAYQRLA